MKRRNLFKKTALSAMGLTLFNFALPLTAQASLGDTFSDDDSDYKAENGWETLVDKPGLILKRKMLFTRPNGIVLDLNGNPVLDKNGNTIEDYLKCQLIRFSKNFTVAKHAHADCELTYVLAGSFLQNQLNQQPISYKVGDTIFMPPQTIHEAALAGEKGVTILSFTAKNIISIK